MIWQQNIMEDYQRCRTVKILQEFSTVQACRRRGCSGCWNPVAACVNWRRKKMPRERSLVHAMMLLDIAHIARSGGPWCPSLFRQIFASKCINKDRSIYIYITSKSSKHKSVLDRIYITIHKQLVAIAAPQNHGVRVIPHTFYPLFLPARIFPMTVTKIRICSINIFHKCKQLPTTSIINWYLLIEQINDIQYHVTWRDMYSNKTTLRQCHRTEHLSTLLDRTTATTVSTAFCF